MLFRSRHVEVQVLGDGAGNAVHLGERECSIQRRHQKIIEESPSSAMDARQRSELAEAALELVRSARYANAGTVEFLLDKGGRFYFLEVNTRLQVEHPVTEMRTGIDLVREQIRIAGERKLRIRQDGIGFNGSAVECRIYAEDPADNYYPSTGVISYLRRPGGFGIREESGIEEGSEVSPYYDPLLSKLIAWAPERGEALARMSAALGAYAIYGVRNNLALLAWVVEHPRFRSGAFSTRFLEECPFIPPSPGGELAETAAAAAFLLENAGAPRMNGGADCGGRWKYQLRPQKREP